MANKKSMVFGAAILVAGLAGCEQYDAGYSSSDAFPSISGDYVNRGAELGANGSTEPLISFAYSDSATAYQPSPTAVAAVAPVVVPQVSAKAATVAAASPKPTAAAKGKGRGFGPTLAAGSGQVVLPFPKPLAEEATKAGRENAELLQVAGTEMLVGRATVNDTRNNRDFIVFYGDEAQNSGSVLWSDMLPFIRQATGCNISRYMGRIKRPARLDLTNTTVLPIDCRNT